MGVVHAGEGGLCGTKVIGRATRLARAALVGLLQDWLVERQQQRCGEGVALEGGIVWVVQRIPAGVLFHLKPETSRHPDIREREE